AKTVLPRFPYVGGIDGINGLGFSNPPLGDFQQLSNDMAVSGRLDFMPPVWPGFAGSVSAYYSPNTTPRGAHDDFGNLLGKSSLTMFDAEFRYRVPSMGWEFRGEYVQTIFGNPSNLRANNDSDPTNNVGKSMFGYSGEVAYHFPLGTILNSEWEAVPFYRYTYQNLQTNGFAGTDVNAPTGAGQLQFHTAGIAVFPSPKVVLKATYQKVINKDPTGANSDSVLGGGACFFRSSGMRQQESNTRPRRPNDPLDSTGRTGGARFDDRAAGLCGPVSVDRTGAETGVPLGDELRAGGRPLLEGAVRWDRARIVRSRSRCRQASLHRLFRRARPGRADQTCRHPAVPGILWRRGPRGQLARAVCRQERCERVEGGSGHPQHF